MNTNTENHPTQDTVWIVCENNWHQKSEVTVNLGVCRRDGIITLITVTPANHNPEKLNNAFQNALLNFVQKTAFDSVVRRWIGRYLKSKKDYVRVITPVIYRLGETDLFRLANVHDLDGTKQVCLLVQVRRADQQGDEEVIRHKIFMKPENVRMLEKYVEIQ